MRNFNINFEVAVKCEVCGKDVEVNYADIDGNRLTVAVNPHSCSNKRFFDFLLSEAQTSGENRISKWLEMKKLEYELKNNIV